MDTTLTIHVAGRADEISPKTMAKAFAAFADLLEAPDDGSHWTMVGAHLGSLTLEARPSARTAEEERAIFDTLVSGLSFFNESGEAPESWSPQGRAAVQTLRERATAPGVEGITAAAPALRLRVDGGCHRTGPYQRVCRYTGSRSHVKRELKGSV